MAQDITITLTDQEVALLLATAEEAKPGVTPAQVQAWAQRAAKEGLRRKVFSVMRELRLEQAEQDVTSTAADWESQSDALE